MLEIASTNLKIMINGVETQTDLMGIIFNLRVTLAEKTLKLPKMATMALTSLLKNCSMTQIGPERHLACPHSQR